MYYLVFLLFVSSFFQIGCSVKYPVVGAFEDYKEVFKGTVDSNLLTGTALIEVEGQVSKIKCRGTSRIVYIPPIAYIIPTCKGQRGEANLRSDDGRVIYAEFETTSCKSGHGTGFDQKGNKFYFTFGMSEAEALEYIKREMTLAAKKPDLPPVYKPKETRKEKGFSTGTGFFITNDGHIITNYHVVEDAKEILIVTADGKRITAKYLNGDNSNDVALLKINLKSSPLPVLEKNNLSKGEEVLTLGYPLIQIQGQEQKASFGRINALTGIKGNINFCQIDIPIQPGNSGGPLLNVKGQVAGVVTATLDVIITLKLSGSLPQNVNYAIKSDYLAPLIRFSLGDKLFVKDFSNEEITKKDMKDIVKTSEKSVVLVIAK